jgi:hypothetical protein
MKAHVIRNWMRDHPRTVLPIVVFLLGTLTYTVRVRVMQYSMLLILDLLDIRSNTPADG